MVTSTLLNGQPATPWATGPNGGSSNANGFTLAQGMTAGWGDADGQTANPLLPVVSQSGASINPLGGDPNWPVQRIGFMRNVPNSLPDGAIYTLNFIYNPTQIGVSFQTDPNSIPPAYLMTPGQTANAVTSLAGLPVTQAQSVGWSLLFDRTYDMMYGNDPAGNRGVLKDVGALYLLMGVFEGGSSSPGVPYSTLVEVVFGQTDNGDIWGFTGMITSANITYGIFRHNMIPSRAEVDLQMTAVYLGGATPATGGSGSAAASSVASTSVGPNTGGAANGTVVPIAGSSAVSANGYTD